MRFLPRAIILTFLGFISLLWWHHLLSTPQQQDHLTVKEEIDVPLTFDALLHIQQVRKKTLRSFCRKKGKLAKLPPTQQEASQALSSIAVNNKLNFLYCKIPATGVEEWEQLLELILEKENVTLQVPVPYHQDFGNEKALSEYKLTSMETLLKTYTKVIFIRDPFQRLISAYMHGLADNLTFKEFIHYILYSGSKNASVEWTPLVKLCRPCLVQYDYIIMYGFLGNEVHYLMLRTGFPDNIQMPEFMDSKLQWTYNWLEEQMFSELSLVQKKRLCHFFRFDFAAFAFPRSLLWDLVCISGNS
ncbi:carbohydrate sulfotransferase 9-like [Python bivittatus]|uniref:Carbohydrate sulfotransferase n=1 Tax=Python bivittatus TaxID=176946 RepID=A0A9F5MY85_PYTBI|nr:carbohydrate sulfotransferase 9-like [Python bivittatus]